MDFPTSGDLFRISRDEMLARNANLNADVIEREGTDANAFTAGAAATGDEAIGQLARGNATLNLDSANGTDLDRLIYDRYNLTRKPASAGFTSVNWSTLAPNPATFNIDSGTTITTADGSKWVTLVGATFLAG